MTLATRLIITKISCYGVPDRNGNEIGAIIIEGAALGVYNSINDILTHPIEATVCMVAGKQVLIYQLCKVLYNVADILAPISLHSDWGPLIKNVFCIL